MKNWDHKKRITPRAGQVLLAQLNNLMERHH
jgi:hypothetical protein